MIAGACGSDPEPAPTATAGDARPAPIPEVEPPPPPPKTPDFPEGTRSLRLTRSVAVRLIPGEEAEGAKRIGTIAQDTRVSWTSTEKAKGCKKPWVEITPRGWVCGEYLEASTRRPSGVELPRLEREELVPGTYGKVTEEGATTFTLPEKPKPAPVKPKAKDKGKAPGKPGKPAKAAKVEDIDGPVASPSQVDPAPAPTGRGKDKDPMVAGRPLLGSVTVRKYGEVSYGDKTYWKVSRGNEYVLRKSVSEHRPSSYQGTRLADDTGLVLPMAFIWPRASGVTKVWTRRTAKLTGTVRQLDQRTPVPILDTVTDKGRTAYRIGPDEWVDAAAVRVAEASEPPPLIGEHERWFDIDLDTQILIAYEGTLPVYATMVSTGKKDTPTITGIWRMWKKISETDMKGLSGEDPYSVATVPWTQFFDPTAGLALHASYWHDKYGITRSHGCVNLAPPDARWLYFWSEPIVPAGWTMAAGVLEAPGSIVRVRSKADPSPPFRGYAKKVQELRETGGS